MLNTPLCNSKQQKQWKLVKERDLFICIMIFKVVSEKNKTISEKQKEQEKGDLASILKEKGPLFLDAQQIFLIESIIEIMKDSHAELRNNADYMNLYPLSNVLQTIVY